MKQLILILALLLPVTLMGQAVNRQELIRTNDLIRGSTVPNRDGQATNLTVHGVRSSDGTPGFDAITGGVTFRDGIYTGGEIFGTNWVTNAVSAIYSNGVVKGTNINALNLARGPDVIFQVNSGAVQAVSVTGLVINTTGSGGLVRSNAPNIHAPTLDGTNLTDQIDAQIGAADALLIQSATNYANSVTNASIVRQTQATALSNALVALAYSIGTDATNFSLLASNAVRLVAGLDATNHAAAILQSATNYANAVTNSSLARQTQLTALSNALVSLSYTIGANNTNYTLTASNGVRLVAGLDATNHANAILQSSTNYANSLTTTLSNSVVSLAYSIGAAATNFTLNASNAVRLVAGLAATNHAEAILQAATNYANGVTNSSIARQTQLTALSNALISFSYSIGSDATNYTLTASNNVRLVAGLAATNHAAAILASSTNFTRAYAQPLGTSAITTNGNQFGASVTITIKDGAFVTNVVIFGQTNVGNADFSKGLTNYSATLSVHSVAGFTSGDGTEYGLTGFLDPSTGKILWFGITNVFATMTNRYVADHLPSPGDCWKIKSTNGYEILWTNGPCGGGGGTSEVWTNDTGSLSLMALDLPAGEALNFGYSGGLALDLSIQSKSDITLGVFDNQPVLALQTFAPGFAYVTLLDGMQNFGDLPYYFNTATNEVTPDEIHTAFATQGTNMVVIRGGGALSISGRTNRYSDDGSQLLRDGVPVPAYPTALASGVGGANTNFTFNLNGNRDLFVDAGTTNANILAMMNWAAGEARTVNVWFTNRTGTVRTISLGAITNNFVGMGSILFPLQITNGVYASFKSMGSSNILYGAQYTALPTN